MGTAAQLGLDLQKSITEWTYSALTQVTGAQAYTIISDQLTLATAVTGHDAIAIAVGILHRVKGLRNSADLVDLEQDGVGRAHFHSFFQALHIGREEIIADDLDAQFSRTDGMALVVILVYWIFDDHKLIFLVLIFVETEEILARLWFSREETH